MAITEAILIFFFVSYYLFSVFLAAAFLSNIGSKSKVGIGTLILKTIIAMIAPMIVPILLGMKIGEAMKDDQ